MSKTDDARKSAEQAAEQPAALVRLLTRTAEEREALAAQIRACQEQLTALAKKIDTAPRAIAPAGAEQHEQRRRLEAELSASVRQQLAEALQDSDNRLAQLRHEVQTE